MKLNQNVQLAFTNIMNSGSYRVITSDDGMSWSDVEFPGKTYQKDANNSISFPTNHFSYFALLSDLAVVPLPNCSMSISPATITNGSSANLSWTLTNSLTGLLMPENTLLGVSGIQSVVPPISSTTRYTIMTSNTSGTATCSAQVTATPAPPPGSTELYPLEFALDRAEWIRNNTYLEYSKFTDWAPESSQYCCRHFWKYVHSTVSKYDNEL